MTPNQLTAGSWEYLAQPVLTQIGVGGGGESLRGEPEATGI